MTFHDAEAAAAALLAARARGEASRLDGALRPPDLDAGIAVQVALARRQGALPPAGFKIAATAPVMQRYLGLAEPLAAFMGAAGLHKTGAVLPWPAGVRLGVECEIGVELGADLGAGCTLAGAAAAVRWMFAAIELVEDRYAGPAHDGASSPAADLVAIGTPALVADQVFHRGAVTGDPGAAWQGLDLAATLGRIEVDGILRGQGAGGDLMGGPLQALAWLAGSPTVRAFGGLRAGQVVMLGSVTPPVWLTGPCTVRVAFDRLGVADLRLVAG